MYEFRKLQLSDWDGYQELMEIIFPDNERSETGFKGMLDDDLSGMFDGHKQIGTLYIRHYDGNSHIHNIGVHPEYQRKGLGMQLMEIAHQKCRSNNSGYVMLYVETENTPAIGLYKKYGYQQISESWHFIIDISLFRTRRNPSTDGYTIKSIDYSHLSHLSRTFPSLDVVQVKQWIDESQQKTASNQFLGLYFHDELKMFVRFNANYSGCMPFKYLDLKDIDPFIQLMIDNYIWSDRNILHVTFDDYNELANMFNSRNERIFHHLYKMRCNLI